MNAIFRQIVPMLMLPCGLLQLATPAFAAADSSQPAVLVELFTSEGCSSCPPADAILQQINNTKTAAGQLIVGISEHVTYWNQLGWSDPFSSDTYTARQNGYGNRFRLDSVYTPQMVINGSEQIVGSDRSGLERALAHESGRPQMTLRIVSATIAGGVVNLTFAAGETTAGQGSEIMAVIADDVDRSSVVRGENSGRTLAHVAVARSMARIATVHGSAEHSGEHSTEQKVQLPLPAGFTSAKGGHHLILFAQQPGLGAVIGIDTRPI